MTSVLQPPRPLSYTTRSPTGGGILLNPSPYHRPSPLPQSSHPSRSNQSLSSSTSSSEDVNTPPSSVHATRPPSLSISLSPPYTSDEDHVLRSRSASAPEYSVSGSRRIRFAPLPDPRRAVLVTEHGEELPLPSVFDDDDPNLRSFHTSPSSSLLLGDSVITQKEPSIIVSSASSPPVQSIRPSVSSPPLSSHTRAIGSPTPSTATLTPAAICSSSSTRLAKRLFYPFRQKNDDSRRSGSRDSSSSRDDTPPSWGIPLGHWASADEASRSTSTNGEPLSRTRSATTNPQPRTKRMLNGRVYGARKHQSDNVFQNIPDAEPEFVEWGFGGMGSVRAGGRWSKVQSDRKLFIGHTEERGRSGIPQASADDEDDGSGMGWVKKRREERERKKREERAAHETASNTNTKTTSNLVSSLVPAPETATALVVSVHHDISTVTLAQPTLADDDESSDESDEEVDDESSNTEQEDDDDDQVCSLSSSAYYEWLRECAGSKRQTGPGCGRGTCQPPSRLILKSST